MTRRTLDHGTRSGEQQSATPHMTEHWNQELCYARHHLPLHRATLSLHHHDPTERGNSTTHDQIIL